MSHTPKRTARFTCIFLAALLLVLSAAERPAVAAGALRRPPAAPAALRLSVASERDEDGAGPERDGEDGEDAEGPAEEKQPPAGALSATDILSDATVIAHGMGAIGDLATSNCLEGFLAQYEAGVRVFEADLRLTRDCQVVLRHDWWHADWQEGISWSNVPTREKFVSTPVLGKYTPLSFRDLLLLMEAYPDICIITDTKFTESDVFTIQFDAMLADARELGLTYLFDRIVVQLYNTNMLAALNNIYHFPHYIYTLYQDDFNRTEQALRDRAAFCAQWGIEGITMDASLWKSAYAEVAREYGIPIYVHTVNDREQARGLLESGVAGVYSDNLTPDSLERRKGRGDISIKL